MARARVVITQAELARDFLGQRRCPQNPALYSEVTDRSGIPHEPVLFLSLSRPVAALMMNPNRRIFPSTELLSAIITHYPSPLLLHR